MDNIIFGVPRDVENAEALMLISTVLVLNALQEVKFIISGYKVSFQHR